MAIRVKTTVRRRRALARGRRAMGRMMMRRGKAVGRARIKRTSDYAKVVEIQETPLVAINDAGGESVGAVVNFTLADFQRPQEVAHAYKYYRAAKVELSFIPYFNIAQTGAAAATRLPQLYLGVDRVSNRWIAPTETELLSRGMSPKLFNKKRSITFKPNLLQELSLETNQPADGTGNGIGVDTVGFLNATALFDKWLPTQQSFGYGDGVVNPQTGQKISPIGVNPYAVRYHGAVFCCAIEGLGTNPTQVGDIQLKITWEFKGPRALKTNAPQPEPNPDVVTSSQGGASAIPNTQPTTYP